MTPEFKRIGDWSEPRGKPWTVGKFIDKTWVYRVNQPFISLNLSRQEVAVIGCLSFESTSSENLKHKNREAWISHIKSSGSSSKAAGRGWPKILWQNSRIIAIPYAHAPNLMQIRFAACKVQRLKQALPVFHVHVNLFSRKLCCWDEFHVEALHVMCWW